MLILQLIWYSLNYRNNFKETKSVYRRMNEAHRNTLQQNRRQLANDIILTEDFFAALMSKGIFDDRLTRLIKVMCIWCVNCKCACNKSYKRYICIRIFILCIVSLRFSLSIYLHSLSVLLYRSNYYVGEYKTCIPHALI